MKKLVLDKVISGLLLNIMPRQKDVLENRYGLKTGVELTLAAIGNRYKITRERVRQIENLALRSIKNKNSQQEGLYQFVSSVSSVMEKYGGARRFDLLINDLRKLMAASLPEKTFSNKVEFLMEISNKFNCSSDSNDYYPFWYLNNDDSQKAQSFVENLTGVLVAGGDWQLELKNPLADNYVSLSKKLTFNNFGDFGLKDWAHINPKTARDWAYLILKKNKKPLHFSQLAKQISRYRKDKETNVQTVHNELIKDGRFVLVGRGIYALKEFDLMAGTCREVIAQILKKHGPQNSKSLVKLVKTERDFKENTLILNLQNRSSFVRLNDGRYTTKEA
jgi:hypothetical protein